MSGRRWSRVGVFIFLDCVVETFGTHAWSSMSAKRVRLCVFVCVVYSVFCNTRVPFILDASRLDSPSGLCHTGGSSGLNTRFLFFSKRACGKLNINCSHGESIKSNFVAMKNVSSATQGRGLAGGGGGGGVVSNKRTVVRVLCERAHARQRHV